MRNPTILALFVLALSLTVTAARAVVYVDCNAPGPAHDGTSWDTAFLTIQEGVNVTGPDGEVWVADGTYVENVLMGEGVQLYGGFLGAEPGGYEDSLDQRDFANNVTTMDGNESGSCVTMASEARVDGFGMVRGTGTPNPWGYTLGGALFCCDIDRTCTITNNTITGCFADAGGGMYAESSSFDLTSNAITGNSATYSGGGIYCLYECRSTITDNTIARNTAWYGGGLFCRDLCSPTLANNTISGNLADMEGGGIYMEIFCEPIVSSNRIDSNTSKQYGGGMYLIQHCSPMVVNNSISQNWAWLEGGGMWCYKDSSPAVSENIIANNRAKDLGGGICCSDGSSPVVRGNIITGNEAYRGRGGGVCSHDGCSLTLIGNIITASVADVSGGGVFCGGVSLTAVNNIVSASSAGTIGGGIYCYSGCAATLTNNTIADNAATNGAGLACDSNYGQHPSTVVLANCILWNGGDEVWNGDNSEVTVTYCDVWGGWPGEGNIDADPLFVDPENGDYHLLPESPCIDAGSNDYVLTDEDIDGDPRIIWAMKFPVPYWPHPGYVDIGADEFVPKGVFGLRLQGRDRAARP